MRSWKNGLVVFAAGLLAGCGGSAGMTLGSGRAIDASSDTLMLSVTGGKDTATLNLGSAVVVVEPARILLNKQAVAPLNPQAARVSVSRSQGQISVVADGQPVYSAKL